jgi:hypothetical protein
MQYPQDLPVVTKTLVREPKLYEAAGNEPGVKISLPFTLNVDRFFNTVALTEIGVHPQGFAKQADQLLLENAGNNYRSLIKKADKNKTPLPGQAEFDILFARYDFSGVRTSSDEDSLSEEEVALRSVLRKTFRDYLRDGALIAGSPKLLVQKAKDAAAEIVPTGTFPLEDFESLVAAAAERSEWTFDWTDYEIEVEGGILGEYTLNFAEPAEFAEDGSPLSYGAIVDLAQQSADEQLAAARATRARMKPVAFKKS